MVLSCSRMIFNGRYGLYETDEFCFGSRRLRKLTCSCFRLDGYIYHRRRCEHSQKYGMTFVSWEIEHSSRVSLKVLQHVNRLTKYRTMVIIFLNGEQGPKSMTLLSSKDWKYPSPTLRLKSILPHSSSILSNSFFARSSHPPI